MTKKTVKTATIENFAEAALKSSVQAAKDTEKVVKDAVENATKALPESMREVADEYSQDFLATYTKYNKFLEEVGSSIEKNLGDFQKSASKINQALFEATITNSNSTLKAAEKLSDAKSFVDTTVIQSDYARTMLKDVSDQAKDVSEHFAEVMETVGNPWAQMALWQFKAWPQTNYKP